MYPEHYAGGIVMAEARLRRRQKRKVRRFQCFKCNRFFDTGKDYWLATQKGCPTCGCKEINFFPKVRAR